MGQKAKAEELRDLLRLAKLLRESANAVVNRDDADLFLRTATALEDRASFLAFGIMPQQDATARYRHIDLVC